MKPKNKTRMYVDLLDSEAKRVEKIQNRLQAEGITNASKAATLRMLILKGLRVLEAAEDAQEPKGVGHA